MHTYMHIITQETHTRPDTHTTLVYIQMAERVAAVLSRPLAASDVEGEFICQVVVGLYRFHVADDYVTRWRHRAE